MNEPSAFSGSRYPGWLMLLGALATIAPLASDMYLPSFPTIAAELAASPGAVTITLSTFFVGLTVGQLFWGPLSDRWGRKPPLYAGMMLYVAATLACAKCNNVEQLMIMRFVQGLGGCAGVIIPTAVIRDRSGLSDAARAYSLLMLIRGLAPILSPWVGGQVLAYWGWRAIFGILALAGGMLLIVVRFGLAESHPIAHEPPLRLRTVVGNYLTLLRNPAFLGYAMTSGLAMAGMFAFIAGAPFVYMDLFHIRSENFGLFFGLNAFGLIAASQFNARLVQFKPPTKVLRRAVWIPAVTGVTLLVASANDAALSLPVVIATCFFYTAALGCVLPNATAAALATHGQMAGTAAALISALQFLCATLAGAAVGALHDGSAVPLGLVMAITGSGSLLCHRLVVMRSSRARI